MKKIILILILFLMVGCSSSNNIKVDYPYEIQSSKVDMSSYTGVSSTNHNFRLIVVSELFRCIDNKSSGIFYLGRNNCSCCQNVCRYLNEVAQELDVTVYYIDAYNENESLKDKDLQNKLASYLNDILNENSDGEKILLTPHVFSIVNGEFYGSQICHDGITFDNEPSQRQINTLKEIYRNIMLPFSNKSVK